MSSSSPEQVLKLVPSQESPLPETSLEEGGETDLNQELLSVGERLSGLRDRLQALQEEMNDYRTDDPDLTPEDRVAIEAFKAERMKVLEAVAGDLRACFTDKLRLESSIASRPIGERESGVYDLAPVNDEPLEAANDNVLPGHESSAEEGPEGVRRQSILDYFGKKLAAADASNDDGAVEVLQGELGTLMRDPKAAVDEDLLQRYVEKDLEEVKARLDAAYEKNNQADIDRLQLETVALLDLEGGLIRVLEPELASAPSESSETVLEAAPEGDLEAAVRNQGFERSRAGEQLEGARAEYTRALKEREALQVRKAAAYEQAQQTLNQLTRQQKDVMDTRDRYLADYQGFTSPLLQGAEISRQNLIFAQAVPAGLVKEYKAITRDREQLGARPSGLFAKLFDREAKWEVKDKALHARMDGVHLAHKEYSGARTHAYELSTKLQNQAIDLGEQMKRLSSVPSPDVVDGEERALSGRIEELHEDLTAAEERYRKMTS